MTPEERKEHLIELGNAGIELMAWKMKLKEAQDEIAKCEAECAELTKLLSSNA